MRRRRIYIGLIVLLLLMAFVGNYSLFTSETVRRHEPMESRREEWQEMAADEINGRALTLEVDGRTVEGVAPYMTRQMELMLPVTGLTDAFACAANRYEDERLVIEKNTISVTMQEGEPSMTVNGIPMSLSVGMTKIGNDYYVPVEAVEKSLAYGSTWSAESGVLSMTGMSSEKRVLPYAYDYRAEGRAPDVKNQGSLGTCWAFASLMALETSLMPEETYDFSEDHMSIRNSFGMDQNDGGEYTMSMAYLLAWQGPVLESQDPYGDRMSPENLAPTKHVQEIQILPSKDYEAIKEAIYYTGGVQSSLYTSLKNEKSRSVYFNEENGAYCYIGTEKPNHDVVIVGWDDNYPKENFNIDLEGDGAFICVNSWGPEFSDGGYFYVSYYDTNIGIHNILYTGVDAPDNYGHIYQSDLCGWVGQLGYNKESAYFANVYEAAGREDLEAVGFYATGQDTRYQVYVSQNVGDPADLSDRTLVAEGSFENAGFYTVRLEEPVELAAGSRFAVIVKITTPGGLRPIAIEYNSEEKTAKVDISDGEGYISLRGTAWERAEEQYGCNLCLKAYTSDRE